MCTRWRVGGAAPREADRATNHRQRPRAAGGIAVFSQATSHSIVPANGHHLTLADDVLPNLELGEDIHTAPTRLISLENTLSGMIFPQEEIVKIARVAQEKGIIMHLDGARIWEAAAARLGEQGAQGDAALQGV